MIAPSESACPVAHHFSYKLANVRPQQPKHGECSASAPFVTFSSGVIMAKKGNAPAVNIGISDKDRKKIADGLSRLLADTYTLYLKTHNFHWNVTGTMFNTLHLMFETQYNELALAVDSIAERIR